MGGPTAAKPKGFLLKMRLVAPDGTPFAEKLYRVKWGDKVTPPPHLPPRQTDKEGALTMLLDGRPKVPHGELQLIERARGKEMVVWCIPLQIADDPPASALPAIEPIPTPPAQGATQAEKDEYEKDLARYMMRVMAPLREHMQELYQAWDQLQINVTTLVGRPSPTASDGELWAAWVALNEAHALVSAGYEAAWRLYNLADLPLDKEPSFPLFSSDMQALIRGANRFAYRRGDARPIALINLPAELDNVKTAHDKRGPFSP